MNRFPFLFSKDSIRDLTLLNSYLNVQSTIFGTMRHINYTLIFAFSGLLLFSCADEQTDPADNQKEAISGLLESIDGGDVRGSSIGDGMEDVLQREKKNVVYNMPDEITCRIPLSMKDSTFYDITYNFNDQGLYVIELDLFPASIEASQSLFNEFKSFYDLRYGASTADDGYTTWFAKSGHGTDVEITMIEESKEMNRPYLGVTFYEHSIND